MHHTYIIITIFIGAAIQDKGYSHLETYFHLDFQVKSSLLFDNKLIKVESYQGPVIQVQSFTLWKKTTTKGKYNHE